MIVKMKEILKNTLKVFQLRGRTNSTLLVSLNVLSISFRSAFNDPSSSCFCDSSQFKTVLKINDLECERCKNLILRQENRRSSTCSDCVEKFYSPKTCSKCCGRISFQDLRDSSVQVSANRKLFNDFADRSVGLKLCDCFPKYPSPVFSSMQPNEVSGLRLYRK